MQIETKITFEDWCQMIKEKYTGKSVLLVHIISLVCLFFAYYFFTQANKIFIYYIFIAFFFEGMSMYKLKKIMETNKDYFKDTYQDNDLTLVYSFFDKTFQIHNKFNDQVTNYEYSVFAEFRETEHFLIIEAYGRQTFIFDKQLANEHKLMDFLLSKNNRVRITKYKKFILF